MRPVPSAVTAAPVLTIAPSDARRAKRARLARTAQLSAAKDQCSDQWDHWHFIILTSACSLDPFTLSAEDSAANTYICLNIVLEVQL